MDIESLKENVEKLQDLETRIALNQGELRKRIAINLPNLFSLKITSKRALGKKLQRNSRVYFSREIFSKAVLRSAGILNFFLN